MTPPTTAPAKPTSTTQQFWDNIDMFEGHWYWSGPYYEKPGLPIMILPNGKVHQARLVAMQITGKRPEDDETYTTCPVGHDCVNPEHTITKKGSKQ